MLKLIDQTVFGKTASFLSLHAIGSYLIGLEDKCRTLLAQLQQPATSTPGLAAIGAAAHMLVGSAGMFGLDRLAYSMRALEEAIRSNALPRSTPMIAACSNRSVTVIQDSLIAMQEQRLQFSTAPLLKKAEKNAPPYPPMTERSVVFPTPSLLFIDDDMELMHLFGDILAKYPNQRFATSAEDGLVMMRKTRPDIVLLDVEMPDQSGLDLCAAMKYDHQLSLTRVIVVTSNDLTSDVVASFAAGGVNHITKPVNAYLLLKTVDDEAEYIRNVSVAPRVVPAAS